MDTELMAARLRSARKLRGRTLDDVAAHVQMNKSTIQRYETGHIRSPKMPVLKELAKYLDVNPAWLAGEDERMEPFAEESDDLERFLEMIQERPEVRALLKSVDGADPAEVRAVMEFFTNLRGRS